MQATLLEALKPVLKGSRRDICLAAMALLADRGEPGITAAELKAELVKARVPAAKNFNVADVLGKAGDLLSAERGHKANVWRLTGSGHDYVNRLLGIETVAPEVKNAADGLTNLAASLTDEVVRGYVEESLLCFQVDARRAAVVFLWSGAIRHLQDKALATPHQELNAALVKHDPKAKTVTKLEDFSAVKDVTQLLAFREIGLLDKGQWGVLQEGLDLRNKCGHPTRYRPGTHKVGAFIEDTIGIVF